MMFMCIVHVVLFIGSVTIRCMTHKHSSALRRTNGIALIRFFRFHLVWFVYVVVGTHSAIEIECRYYCTFVSYARFKRCGLRIFAIVFIWKMSTLLCIAFILNEHCVCVVWVCVSLSFRPHSMTLYESKYKHDIIAAVKFWFGVRYKMWNWILSILPRLHGRWCRNSHTVFFIAVTTNNRPIVFMGKKSKTNTQ